VLSRGSLRRVALPVPSQPGLASPPAAQRPSPAQRGARRRSLYRRHPRGRG